MTRAASTVTLPTQVYAGEVEQRRPRLLLPGHLHCQVARPVEGEARRALQRVAGRAVLLQAPGALAEHGASLPPHHVLEHAPPQELQQTRQLPAGVHLVTPITPS